MCTDPHPRQTVPAAELPWGNVGGTGEAFQHDVGSFRVSHKVKFSTHGGVTPGFKIIQKYLLIIISRYLKSEIFLKKS